MTDIVVRTFKNLDLTGTDLLVAVPSIGLASTIAATYLITTLKSDQIAAFDSDDFPPLSMVYAHKPKFPVRVYHAAKEKLSIFISEVPLPPPTHRPLARTLLEWAKARGSPRIVCLEGLPLPEEQQEKDIDVWAVGSTDRANAAIEAAGLPYLESGMVAGVTGVLLNEGRWAAYDVIALLGEARTYLPDAVAAARLVESADKLLANVEIDLTPLLAQAKELEAHLRTLKDQAQPVSPPSDAPSYYR
jgi:predicted ATP-grasp superfamily ATP-dependent carboligase